MNRLLFHAIAWPVWCLFLPVPFYYVYRIDLIREAVRTSGLNLNFDIPFSKLAIIVIVIAMIEGAATLFLRYFFLNRPFRRGMLSVSTAAGSFRFFFVSLINWIISASLSLYGVTLYMLSEEKQFLYFFCALAGGLILIHAPRLLPYEVEETKQA